MRFVRADGSFDHTAIDAAWRARLRHYKLFDDKIPGVVTLDDWKRSVMDALEAEILTEKRQWQREKVLLETLKGIGGR